LEWPGTYRLTQVLPSGDLATTPTSISYTLTAQSGSNVSGEIFGDLAVSASLANGQTGYAEDATTAGRGWYLDGAAVDSAAYAWNGQEWQAAPGSAAYGRVDLLTVVAHELGHVLELVDVDPSVQADAIMTATLPTGVRRPVVGRFSKPSYVDGWATRPTLSAQPLLAASQPQHAVDTVFATPDDAQAANALVVPSPAAAAATQVVLHERGHVQGYGAGAFAGQHGETGNGGCGAACHRSAVCCPCHFLGRAADYVAERRLVAERSASCLPRDGPGLCRRGSPPPDGWAGRMAGVPQLTAYPKRHAGSAGVVPSRKPGRRQPNPNQAPGKCQAFAWRLPIHLPTTGRWGKITSPFGTACKAIPRGCYPLTGIFERCRVV
jgi:hypothetical protein